EQRGLETLWTFDDGAVGEFASVIDRLSCLLIAPAPDGIVILQCESQRIDAAVATGAGGGGAMLREHLANSLRSIGRRLLIQRRNSRGRRWRRCAEDRIENPGTAQHRTGAIRIR